jgi:hypothetical protein
MYIAIYEMLDEISNSKDKEEKIKTIQKYARIYPYFVNFLRWGYFNTKISVYTNIPDYKPNMVDVTLSYIKLEKALSYLKYFFDGPEFIENPKKRTDKLFTVLEEISYIEAPMFESLVLNNFKNYHGIILTKEEILEALPDMKEIK